VKKPFAPKEESPAAQLPPFSPQGFPAERSSRPTIFEPASDTNPSGRRTVAYGESSLTTNLADAPEVVVVSEAADAKTGTVITSLPMATPVGGGAAKDSSRLIEKSDSLGAWVVWIIIIILTLAAGLIAWRLFSSRKQQTAAVTSQPVEPSTSPDVAPGPAQFPAVSVVAPEGMVYVPGGAFRMGRDGGDEFESPAHPLTVSPFFIDRTEVTNEEYQRFVSATGHRAPVHWVDGKIPDGQAKFPVVNVSWDDANAYAQWANKRLPTEEEWEFAARGADERIYPWGNDWRQENANAGRDRLGGLVEAGRYAAGASPFGALDMSGNVWEWTASDYQDYPGRKTPSSLASAGLKVIRGGAYDVPPKRATATYRGALSPDRIPDKTGFRLARDVQ
jgi:formylglycine-generating enzyme required for sulfatase activity